jgi:hypothetical protein
VAHSVRNVASFVGHSTLRGCWLTRLSLGLQQLACFEARRSDMRSSSHLLSTLPSHDHDDLLGLARRSARLRRREARAKTSSRKRCFNPSLAGAFLTLRWIYFAPRLDRLRYFGKSSAFTCGAFDFYDGTFSFRLFHMNHFLEMSNDTLTPSSAPALHAPCRYAELKSCCRHPNQW